MWCNLLGLLLRLLRLLRVRLLCYLRRGRRLNARLGGSEGRLDVRSHIRHDRGRTLCGRATGLCGGIWARRWRGLDRGRGALRELLVVRLGLGLHVRGYGQLGAGRNIGRDGSGSDRCAWDERRRSGFHFLLRLRPFGGL